ncbi:cupredoxin domain-containing protein [Halopseudomonas maritima]|uniref:cupredoxin domain-containing protein n=1 Tax=Halopseudomonas maritima TaxID=2918528 RepID=UPI0037C16063
MNLAGALPLSAALAALLLSLFANAAQAGGLPTVELEIRDGAFDPAIIQVTAGQRFKINLHNRGNGPVEFESLPLRVEKVLGPGVSSFVVIHPLRPGRYSFFDEFHLAMPEGVIEVR